MRQLIKNAKVIDGSGKAAFHSDLLIEGQVIAEVGSSIDGGADEVIDAAGAFVCPGFIDVHSHADLAAFLPQGFRPKVLQGVTTELVGFVRAWRRAAA